MEHDKYTKLAIWEYSRRVDLGKILKEVCQKCHLEIKNQLIGSVNFLHVYCLCVMKFI